MISNPNMHLAIFDFDGTITHKDSLFDFIAYAVKPPVYYAGLFCLIPVLIAYKLKILANNKTKEAVLSQFFKDWELQRFECTAKAYSDRIPSIVRKAALERIHWHLNQGHTVVIASASLENYLKDWCAKLQVGLVGSHIEFINEKCTGRLVGANCYGQEKVRRLQEKYNLKNFDRIYAYGDSPSDYALKNIAHEFYYKYF